MIVMDDLLREFLSETGEHLDTVEAELARLQSNPADQVILRSVFRLVHTIKGTCGFLGLPRLEALAHASETLMGRLQDGAAATRSDVLLIVASIDRIKLVMTELERSGTEPLGSDAELLREIEAAACRSEGAARDCRVTVPREMPERSSSDDVPRAPGAEPGFAGGGNGKQTVRVAVDTLDRLMMTVSELVLARNELMDAARRAEDAFGLDAPLQRLSNLTAALQDGVMQTRLQPIGAAWGKLPRFARELSIELGKRLELVLQGSETELDRQVLELIRDPLTHMVRNSAAHGIEMPAERIAAGKPEVGTIRLAAFQEESAITIEVSDDGQGLDLRAIRRRAAELGLGAAADLARMPDERAMELIFQPGFSTSPTVTSVAGRGMGMDVVRTNVDMIGGTVEIASEPGRGTTFRLRLPLTLAIMPTLIVKVSGQRFGIPQASLLEIVQLDSGRERRLELGDDGPVIRMRDGLLPVVDPARIMSLQASDGETGLVVALQAGPVRFGLLVEAVLHMEEVLVKPMPSGIRGIPPFSGNAVLGDGTVALILDPKGIARAVGLRASLDTPDAHGASAAAELPAATLYLVVRGSRGRLRAVSLAQVARVETIAPDSIERAGQAAAFLSGGRLIPLVPIDPDLQVGSEKAQPIVVLSENGASWGLAVAEILQIAEAPLDATMLGGEGAEVVDIADYLARPPDGAAGPALPPSSDPLVLLVDDNPFIQQMLIPVLSRAGYRVRVAADADGALAAVLDHLPDAVVTDLELPGRPGLDLVAALRRHPATAGLPVVALSSRPDAAHLRRARALGVCEVVGKFDRSRLVQALAQVSAARGLAA